MTTDHRAGSRREGGEQGFMLAALLVGLAVMAVVMSAALPAWSTLARREREAELIFRGGQYARAITLYQRKYANASPPNFDVLVEERMLRRKYEDPITNDEFQPILAGSPLPGQQAGAPGGRDGGAGRGGTNQIRLAAPGQGTAVAGIIGVTSKSTEKSLRLYQGRDAYNQWVFMGVQQSTQAGGQGGAAGEIGTGRGGRGDGGGRGGRGAEPGNRGRGRGPQPALPPSGRGGRGGFDSRNFEN